MNNYSVFDIIGPRMIGPSSSHTAGAARLARMAWIISGKDVVKAKLTLYGSFAETGTGHGTDKALVAGILGMDSDDSRLRFSRLLAEEAGIDIELVYSDEEVSHPNTVKIETESSNGEKCEIVGASIGGGNIIISKFNGMSVRISGEYPTLLVHYEDAPGAINCVTQILAKFNINVAFMRVFRKELGTEACMVIETDSPVTPDIVNEIKSSNKSFYEVREIVQE